MIARIVCNDDGWQSRIIALRSKPDIGEEIELERGTFRVVSIKHLPCDFDAWIEIHVTEVRQLELQERDV